MPVQEGEDDKVHYNVETSDIKLVCDYTGLNFNEAVELDCFTFKTVFRDAFIDKLQQSEQGREYLENCWIINQTEPDREKLRQKYKQE